MGSSKTIVGLFVLTASAAFAQEPPASTRDDVNATMQVIAPDAENADDVVRKIPSKSKRTGKSTDAPAKDLATPGKDEPDESGSPDGPGTSTPPDMPTDPDTSAPDSPVSPPDTPRGDGHGGGKGPDVGGAPDPRERSGGIGRGVSEDAKNRGKDARHHQDAPAPKDKPKDKPPRGPGAKPPDPTPPGGPRAKPPDTMPPGGPRNPGTKPPDRRPPGPPPRTPHPPRPG